MYPTAAVVPCESPRSDADAVSRPSLYIHAPQARAAPLEDYYDGLGDDAKLLDQLKSDRLEGVYNLSFLLLAFTLLYLFVRNILEVGFVAGPGAVCMARLRADAARLALMLPALALPFVVAFALVCALRDAILSPRAVVSLHVASLLLFFYTATKSLFFANLSPFFALIHGLLVVVVALKTHSFVYTNRLLAEETAQRKTSRRARRARHAKKRIAAAAAAAAATDGTVPTSLLLSSISSSSSSSSFSSSSSSSVEGEQKRHKEKAQEVKQQTSPTESKKQNHTCAKSRCKVTYPSNVTWDNVLYYALAPTLVYETSYPRTRTVRPRYVGWYIMQMALCASLQYILVMQFCVPIWTAGRGAGEPRLLWYIVKLALPCFVVWLLLFWGFFHCALNVIAELTRFADRQFYREWWNACTLHEFWRLWNVLVHEWCLRHLYVESVSRLKVGRSTATLGTFIMSAVLHEYVCFCGFGMMRPYMFMGMILQIPLMSVSTHLKGTRKGNMLMWVMLFFGQSSMGLLYVRDYLNRNGSLMC